MYGMMGCDVTYGKMWFRSFTKSGFDYACMERKRGFYIHEVVSGVWAVLFAFPILILCFSLIGERGGTLHRS